MRWKKLTTKCVQFTQHPRAYSRLQTKRLSLLCKWSFSFFIKPDLETCIMKSILCVWLERIFLWNPTHSLLISLHFSHIRPFGEDFIFNRDNMCTLCRQPPPVWNLQRLCGSPAPYAAMLWIEHLVDSAHFVHFAKTLRFSEAALLLGGHCETVHISLLLQKAHLAHLCSLLLLV